MNGAFKAKESITAHMKTPMLGEAVAGCDGLALTSPQGWPSFAISTA